MKGNAIGDAVSALRRFVAAKPASDRLAVFAFASKAIELTRFSSATIDADTALRTVGVDRKQGTALWDAVVAGSHALARESSPGRVLVVLTDGADTAKDASRADAIAAARRAHVAVYAVGIEGDQFSPAPLRALAQATGGRYFGAASSGALAGVYTSLAAELARTWRLDYVTAGRPGDQMHVSVSARRGGSTETAFRIAGTPDRHKASPLVPTFLYSPLGTLLVAGAVGALALLVVVLLGAARRGSWLRGRLAPHLKTYVGEATPEGHRERLALAAEVFQATERSLGHFRLWKALERLIERSDLPIRAVQLVYIGVGSAFVLGLIAAVMGLPTPAILAALGLGALLPIGFVWRAAKKRTKAFEDQLPDLLMTIAASLKAGHSFKQGIQTVVEEGEPPASKEFQRVLTEIQLGRPMDEALGEMTARVGSNNFDFVMTAITIQRQVGGSLAGLFDTVAQTVRDRQQFARKIRSLTAMGRGSAYMLIALPFLLAGALTALNPSYMNPLYTTSSGHTLIIVGLISMTIGSLVLRKIVSFKG
jgi:tight adherence protein B